MNSIFYIASGISIGIGAFLVFIADSSEWGSFFTVIGILFLGCHFYVSPKFKKYRGGGIILIIGALFALLSRLII